MRNAYGLIEITGVVAAVDALDIMCKAADVSLSTWERKLGGRLVTIIVEGDVAAVTAAVEAVRTKAIKKPAAWGVIAAPHDEIVAQVQRSASRFRPVEQAACGQSDLPAPAAETMDKPEKESSAPVGSRTQAARKKTEGSGMARSKSGARTVKTADAGTGPKTGAGTGIYASGAADTGKQAEAGDADPAGQKPKQTSKRRVRKEDGSDTDGQK